MSDNNRQKNRRKPTKFVGSEKFFVGFCRCLKTDEKTDKTDEKPTKRFVGFHPSSSVLDKNLVLAICCLCINFPSDSILASHR